MKTKLNTLSDYTALHMQLSTDFSILLKEKCIKGEPNSESLCTKINAIYGDDAPKAPPQNETCT